MKFTTFRHRRSYGEPRRQRRWYPDEIPHTNRAYFTVDGKWDSELHLLKAAAWQVGVRLTNLFTRRGYCTGGPCHGSNDGQTTFHFEPKRGYRWALMAHTFDPTRAEVYFTLELQRVGRRGWRVQAKQEHTLLYRDGTMAIQRNRWSSEPMPPESWWTWTKETHEAVVDAMLATIIRGQKCADVNPRGSYGTCRSCPRELECLLGKG